ncbi:MAG: hypothetical protein GC151_17610 [Betaproteobacteria bacterium]|nr:hypothetical protein [Betaproteobacteria bacterium]
MSTSNDTAANAGVTAVYKVSADRLWQAVDFHQPSENIMPPIASSTLHGKGLGARKVNTLQGGGEVHLQLVYYAPGQHAFNYVIQSSPLPVVNYVGEVRVTALGADRAQLTWRGVFDPNGVPREQADSILQGFYESIAGRLGERFPKE